MSASSSPVKHSNSKPLNPLASSYEPQSIPPIGEPRYPQDKIYLPHQFPLESHHSYEAPSLLRQVSELQSGIFLHHLVSLDFCPYPSFGYCSPGTWDNKGGCLNLYDSEKQPHPWSKVFHRPESIPYNGINYWSERIVKKKKKGKWGFIPPRLKPPREYPMHSRGVWVKKEDAEKIKASSDVPLLPPVTDEKQTKLDGKTSVMIKNVPNHFQRVDLQRMLDYHCRTENRKAQPGSNFCKSAYDFLYLPMDFGFHLNLGFAFVNFTSAVAALRFYRAFNNGEWSFGDSRKKTCEIGIAKFQGKDALREQFRKSSFPCHTNEYLPVVFSPPRDGFNSSGPTLVGRLTHVIETPKDQNVMIMTKRKKKKA
ncbi:protein MEI2-like 1 [Durio zibethinus]|uniref:Protein MEI2-like 1 n=1 Tax=Durio zibethinus TaxID=66656 RepID=A0A6P5ZEX1_DURZI|nr:protein MEI2-like 1 [Durio zibethinus]